LLDAASIGDERLRAPADGLVVVGCVGAIGAALTGLADWQDTNGKERRTGITHALLNVSGLGLFLTSLWLRRSGRRAAGLTASAAGYGLALLASYLGGDLVFRFGTQVNRTAWPEYPADWTAALAESELAEGKLTLGLAGSLPILLVRQAGRIYAMYDVCPHQGGPLHEGTLQSSSVICPWHASQFDLATGAIIHGPSEYKPPLFETRVSNGQVEVRLSPELG
jgi:nitrite reductase/ring-hydroxylating ferredoxin subunit